MWLSYPYLSNTQVYVVLHDVDHARNTFCFLLFVIWFFRILLMIVLQVPGAVPHSFVFLRCAHTQCTYSAQKCVCHCCYHSVVFFALNIFMYIS